MVMPLGIRQFTASIRDDVLLAGWIALYKHNPKANPARIGMDFCGPVFVEMA